ncbi:hypothetical protein ACHAXA_005779, partial [Cyclostephanos tholiformis]
MRTKSVRGNEHNNKKGRRAVVVHGFAAIAMATALCGRSPPVIVDALLSHSPSPTRRVLRVQKATASVGRRVTRIAYKDLCDDDGEERDDPFHTKHDVPESVVGKRRMDVKVEVKVEIDRAVIYYDDLGDDPPELIAAVDVDEDDVGLAGFDDITSVVEADDLIHELGDNPDPGEDANIEEEKMAKAIKAIEPSIEKPAKKFISPIQLIKKVPTVVPLSMSTVFFLRLVGEWPALGTTTSQKKGGYDDRRRAPTRSPPTPSAVEEDEKGPPTVEATNDAKSTEVTRSTKTIVESVKTRMGTWMKKSTPFSTTSYLESLSANVPPPSDDTKGERSDDAIVNENDGYDVKEDNELMRSLRSQKDQIIEGQREAMSKAMREAQRRTNPKEVIARRNEEAQRLFKEKERAMLERLYAERREKLDAKKRRADDCSRSEGKERERREEGRVDDDELPERRRRMIPILDVLIGKNAVAEVPLLLVGRAMTIPYANLTSFQRMALDAAMSNTEDHRGTMIVDEHNNLSSVLAGAGECAVVHSAPAPLIAIIDDLTASSSLSSSLWQENRGDNARRRRYATLASIEMIEDGNGRERRTTAVRLMGVGRAFLGDYFLSRKDEEATMVDEEDLFNNLDIHSDEGQEGIQVIMADFDVFLDDPSLLANRESATNISLVHSIAELYRAANRVYRLHEERKRLVTGLRAGVARLRLGKRSMVHLDPNVELKDCDEPGLFGRAPSDNVVNNLDSSTPSDSALRKDGVYDDSIRRELVAMNNYGILSTIPDLTHELMSHLKPYYSTAHREREEYEAEVSSMVVLKTLEDYATPVELAA